MLCAYPLTVESRLVSFLSGLAHITLPSPSPDSKAGEDEAWITGGAYGLLVALDTEGTGHVTTYPGDEATVSLQIPFGDAGDVPAHEVLADGPCRFGGRSGQLVD